ncbi:MAG: hypothetical protein OXQ90_03160 [Gammaproteobacteria bacterium]|nr:hypothetical protein [Gammaproteobacteria bacterium]
MGLTSVQPAEATGQDVIELQESFDVFLPLSAVWERLRLPDESATGASRIPGFPSIDGSPGCAVAVDVSEPQKRLAGTKADQPCAGTRIDIEIGPANASGWPTRLSLAQSGFEAPLADLPDFLNAHWQRIVADFRLYVEHGVTAPPAAWRTTLGATTRETPTGLAVTDMVPEAFADRCGMREDDILLTLAGVRILDTVQLWTVLAMLAPGDLAKATWVRDGAVLESESVLGGY